MDLRDDRGTFADRRGDPLGRSGSDVADREHARVARLKRQNGTTKIHAAGGSRNNEALTIPGNAVLEPIDIWIGTDKQKKMVHGADMRNTRRALAERDASQALRAISIKAHNLRMRMQIDIR
jgi:hypothetical protein